MEIENENAQAGNPLVFEYLTLEQEKELLQRANQLNEDAINELVYRLASGKFRRLMGKDIQPDLWKVIAGRVQNNDHYTIIVILIYPTEMFSQEFPDLIQNTKNRAHQGVAQAQYNLANAYFHGKGVPQDHAKAVEWWQKAALQGYPQAQCNLANAYFHGKGVPQAPAKAVEWLQKATLQGHPQAQCNLAKAYSEGKGVPQDPAKAVEWLQKAALQGHPQAQYNLANAYFYGKGIKQNRPEAIHYFLLAAKRNLQEAKFQLKKILPINAQELQGDSTEVVDFFSEALKYAEKLSSYHQKEVILNTEADDWPEQKFAIPEISPYHQDVADFGDSLVKLLHGLAQPKAGFMVSCVELSKELKTDIESKEQEYIDILTHRGKTYVSFEEENVKLGVQFVHVVTHLSEIDSTLDVLIKEHMPPLSALKAAQVEAKISEEGKKRFAEEKERYNWILKTNKPQIDLLTQQKVQLGWIKDQLENYVPAYASRRNKEFIDEFKLTK